jgi:CheY-like chemotaxis protein
MPKIFILDDDYISNELNRFIFRFIGINDVDIRMTVSEALHYLQQCNENNAYPDLLFVDLNLPGMNGFKFITEYEKNFMKFNPGQRIIILTNSISDEDRHKAMEYVSVLDFLSKPLRKNKLKEILQKVNVDTSFS